MEKFLDKLRDPYEQKARIFPGLLVICPLLIPLAGTYGPRDILLTSIMGLLISCGAIYLLAAVTRGLGKQLEEKLARKWGGMPTTIILRHRDNFFDRVSKMDIHAAIQYKLSINMPTEEEEEANPTWADGAYEGATRKLRELSRNDRGLVFKENIAYGFHRNMLALKPVGISICLLSIIYALFLAKVIEIPFSINVLNLIQVGITAWITLLSAISLLLIWILYFNEHAVKRIGYAYAERLFEFLKKVPKQKANPKP